MQRTDFYYDLPAELIARYPVEQRSASRLLCLDKLTGELSHKNFFDLPSLLQPGDLLVFNDTRVIPARLFGTKATGGKVEILVERMLDGQRALVHLKASKPPKIGAMITFAKGVTAEVLQRHDDLYEVGFFTPPPSLPPQVGEELRNTALQGEELKSVAPQVLDILEAIGHIPLPPYMERADEEADRERYQTVYAKNPGAVAAPTAGLHFDAALLSQLKERGIETAFVTLHVGAGTFQPVRVDNLSEHVMHTEYAEVSAATCDKIAKAKAAGKRVIAVGTTSVRCLETAAQNGTVQPYQGETQIFIYPGYQFRCIDALITNFHLPESTLIMLVCAFAGYETTMYAYQTAVQQQYRFFSYGDAMWIA